MKKLTVRLTPEERDILHSALRHLGAEVKVKEERQE